MIPKLTKKQTRKLTSRKTKKLLSGGGFFKNPFKSKTKSPSIPSEPLKIQPNITTPYAESPYAHLQRVRPISPAEKLLRKTSSRTLISHLDEIKGKKLSSEAKQKYFNELHSKLSLKKNKTGKVSRENILSAINELRTTSQPNSTYASLQRPLAPPPISASTSTPPPVPPPRKPVSSSAAAPIIGKSVGNESNPLNFMEPNPAYEPVNPKSVNSEPVYSSVLPKHQRKSTAP